MKLTLSKLTTNKIIEYNFNIDHRVQDEKELQEINHRFKNIMTVIITVKIYTIECIHLFICYIFI